MRKIKELLAAAAGFLFVLAAQASAALAGDGTAGISQKTADEVATKVVDLVKGITTPLGSAIIFVSIVVVAFKIIATANKPEERAKAMGSIPYILGGGLMLGLALMLAGFVIGLMTQAGQ
jgi:hypothetical protein